MSADRPGGATRRTVDDGTGPAPAPAPADDHPGPGGARPGPACSSPAPTATAALDAARARLAREQAAFVATLVGGAEDVLGLDERGLEAARRGLFRKRLHVLGHHFPGLAAGLRTEGRRPEGEPRPAWDAAFAWHLAHPPLAAGHLADGAGLVAFLEARGLLPSVALRDAMAVRMTHRLPGDGTAVPRRGPFVQVTRVLGRPVLVWGAGRRRGARELSAAGARLSPR